MAILHREQTARRKYWCDVCRGPIPAGTRYTRTCATPNDSDLGNVRWWVIKCHGRSAHDCPETLR